MFRTTTQQTHHVSSFANPTQNSCLQHREVSRRLHKWKHEHHRGGLPFNSTGRRGARQGPCRIPQRSYPAPSADNLVPTSDTAFEIIAVGPSVKGWKVGQRVCANFCPDHIHGENTSEGRDSALGAVAPGVLTEYRTFPAHSLVVIPEHLSYEEASTLPCAGLTAHNALLGSKPIKGGDVVLVLGTGGISIFALQIAVASGAVVIATSSSDEKLRVASKLGAIHLINYNKTPKWDK